jgi:hypothetical protein
MPELNPVTGEPQNASGWSTDDPTDAAPGNGAGAGSLSPQSALAMTNATNKYTRQLDTLAADEQKEFAAGEAAQDPYRKKIVGMLDSPNVAQAHLEKVKDAPKPEDYKKYSMEFFSSMAVLGAIAGRFTRKGGTTALNAFAGALKGWQQGNLQAYESAAKEWEASAKQTIENNNIEVEKYKEVMADKKANIDQMMAAMNIVAAEHQNKIMFDATMEKNYTMAFGAVDKMTAAQTRAQGAVDKLTGLRGQQRDETLTKIEELNKNPDMMARLSDKDYLQLKGAAHALGVTLNDKPVMSSGGQSAVDLVGTYKESLATALSRMPAPEREAFQSQLLAKYPDFNQQLYNSQNAEKTSEARVVGGRVGKVEYANNLVQENIPAAAKAAKAFPQGNFVPVNLAKLWQGHIDSSVPLSEWDVVNLQLLENYALFMNPGATTIRQDMFERAGAALSQAKSTDAYLATLKAIQGAGERERRAGQKTISEVQGGGVKPPGGSSTAGKEQTATNPDTGETVVLRNGKWVPQ